MCRGKLCESRKLALIHLKSDNERTAGAKVEALGNARAYLKSI